MKKIFIFWTLLFGCFLFPSFAAPPPAENTPLTLRACYELALKRSETVAIQKEEIEEAEAQIFEATSEALGDVDFVMEKFHQANPAGGGDSSSIGRTFTDPERLESRFTISQPLFRGFRALGALTGAGSLTKQQKEEWFRAKELLFLDVANAFYGLLREKKDLRALQEIHVLIRHRIEELTEREQIGRSRSSEVVTATARMKALEAERAHTRGSLKVARHVLEFLTGIELGGRRLAEENLPQEPSREISDYLAAAELRSDVQAAKQSMKTARQGIVVAQSEFWPELSLEHNRYQRREGVQADIDWDLLFKLDVPLFRGGGTVGKVKEAVSRWKKEKLAYSLALRQAEFEIKEAYQNWIASVAEDASLKEAVKSAADNFRLQREEYKRNLVSNLDVITALEFLHQTRRDSNHAYYQMKENYWGLRVAAGEKI